MAHYAFLDSNNIVLRVIVGKDEGDVDWEEYYKAKKTSYNTRGGIHYDPITKQPSADQSKAFRKNYAGIGYAYDETRDAFIPPNPFPSWSLNEESCNWVPPVEYPEDGNYYEWNEDNQTWDAVPNINIDNN